MGFTPEQIKGRIKSVAKQNNADARTLMRIYMMERFLERLAQSEYRDNFIIKGGILVTAMIGVAHRSTMDIDTSMKNLNLSAEDALRVVNRVKDIDLDDGVSFDVKDVSNIMDEMEYPGIRVTMNANVGRLITPLKIDISTGDVITPRAIEFNYDLLLEDRSISLWSYNLETILAEKLQTVLARGIPGISSRASASTPALARIITIPALVTAATVCRKTPSSSSPTTRMCRKISSRPSWSPTAPARISLQTGCSRWPATTATGKRTSTTRRTRSPVSSASTA